MTPCHPFEDLRTRVIALQRDLKAALNAGTEDAGRLVELMTWCRALRHPATPAGDIEFLPTLGVPLLLRLAVDPDPRPKLNSVKVVEQYMAATGAWVPPWVELQKQAKARREGGHD